LQVSATLTSARDALLAGEGSAARILELSDACATALSSATLASDNAFGLAFAAFAEAVRSGEAELSELSAEALREKLTEDIKAFDAALALALLAEYTNEKVADDTVLRLMGIFGMQADITVLSTADWVLLALSALTIFTFGPVNVGCTYILRNVFRGEGIFLWHDFFYAIKRNIRQGIIYGIMDAVITVLLLYDIFFFNLNYGGHTVLNMMFFAALFMAILYLIMRPYIYLMLVTFDLSILKMFKNALLFTVLGVKRNIMSLLGIILLGVLEFALLMLYFPLGVILPFVGLFSIGYMMQIYGAFPKIKEIMIDPYYEK